MSMNSKFNDLMAVPTMVNSARTRQTHPTGWEPGITSDDQGNTTVVTGLLPKMDDTDSWKAAVESLGVTIPEGYIIRLVEARYDEAAWHRDKQGEDAVTRPAWRYKFKIESAPVSQVSYDDLIELIKKHRARKPLAVSSLIDGCWILATGDWQLGKMDGDGTEGTVARILESVDCAIARIKELRKNGKWPGYAAIILTGDCVEGFNSQHGANIWRTTLTMTEQVRLYRRLVLEVVTRIAREVEKVIVIPVPGNHGETVRVAGKMATRIDDSWDIDAVIAVSETLAQNPEVYGHVKFVTPAKDEGTVVIDLGGTITAVAHGHQVPGSNVPKWVAEHAKNMAPVGDAHLIITGHRHFFKMEPMGPRMWIQVPAMESESTWWRHKTGDISVPGMVSLLVADGHWSDLAIL